MFKKIKEDNILTLKKSEWDKFQKYLNSKKEPSKELKELMNLKGEIHSPDFFDTILIRSCVKKDENDYMKEIR